MCESECATVWTSHISFESGLCLHLRVQDTSGLNDVDIGQPHILPTQIGKDRQLESKRIKKWNERAKHRIDLFEANVSVENHFHFGFRWKLIPVQTHYKPAHATARTHPRLYGVPNTRHDSGGFFFQPGKTNFINWIFSSLILLYWNRNRLFCLEVPLTLPFLPLPQNSTCLCKYTACGRGI